MSYAFEKKFNTIIEAVIWFCHRESDDYCFDCPLQEPAHIRRDENQGLALPYCCEWAVEHKAEAVKLMGMSMVSESDNPAGDDADSCCDDADGCSDGKSLKQIRLEMGVTQRDLANKCGINHSIISRLEAQKCDNMTVSTAKKLAAALGIPLIELMQITEMEKWQSD